MATPSYTTSGDTILAQHPTEPAVENEPVTEPRQESGAESAEYPAPEQRQPFDLLPAIRDIEAARFAVL